MAMELDIIKTDTTWNDAAGSVNKNFSKLKLAIDQGVGSNVVVDTEMSDTSENAVQNKVIKAYTDGRFFSQAQFDPAKTHDYVKSYIHYDDEAPKTLEIGVDLIIKDDIDNAAEDDLDNGIFNNGLVTALGVKKYVSNLGGVDEELLEGYMPMSRDFSEDFNNDFAR